MLNHRGKEIQKSLFCSSSNFSFPTKKPYIQINRIYFFMNPSVNHLLLSPLTHDQETRTIKCKLAPTMKLTGPHYLPKAEMRPSKWKLFDMDESSPLVPRLCFLSRTCVSGIEGTLKYSFHCPNTCSVEVSSTSFFVWAIARTALHLACQCLPAPSRVLQTIWAPIQLLLQLDGSHHLQQPLSDLRWDHDRRGCRTCWKWEPNTLLTGPLPDEASTPSLYVWIHQAFPASSFTTWSNSPLGDDQFTIECLFTLSVQNIARKPNWLSTCNLDCPFAACTYEHPYG